jgi:type I restriction enzyme M protein
MDHPQPGTDPLLKRSQIAALAGVSRSTVTTWERQESFPSPRRSNGQDLFRRSEILTWLDQRTVPLARRVAGEEPGVTYGHRVRRAWMGSSHARDDDARRQPTAAVDVPDPEDQKVVRELMGAAVDRVRGAASVVDYLNLLLSLHYLHRADSARWSRLWKRAGTITDLDGASRLIREIGRAIDEDMHRFAVTSGMEEALGRLEPRTARDLRQVIDRVSRLRGDVFGLILDEYEQRAALGSREFFTPRPVVRLMTRLALSGYEGPDGPRCAYDPYARGGEFLVEAAAACARWQADAPGPVAVRAYGESRRADTWRLASMNLALHGVPPELELRRTAPWEHDARRKPLPPADIVLTNPPFNMTDPAGPQRREGEWPYGAPPVDNDNFAYVQHCLAMLREGGRAGIIMPNKAGNAVHKAEREIRRKLITGGVVESVIALPTKLFTGTAVPVAAWLLRHPSQPCDQVLFLDASHLGVKIGARRVLGEDDIEAILATIHHAYEPGRHPADAPGAVPVDGAIPTALVSRDELRARDYSLNPFDHVPRVRSGETAPESALATAWRQWDEQHKRLLRERRDAADRLPYLGYHGPPTGRDRPRVTSLPLGDLCEIQAGPSYSKLGKAQRIPDGEVPVVFPRHLSQGRISDASDERVSLRTARGLVGFVLEVDDIVCVRSGAIGPPALVRGAQAGWLMSPNVIRLRVRAPGQVLPAYLLYYLGRDEAVAWMRDRAAATAAPSLRTDSLGTLKIPLPALSEQHAIASTLEGLDGLDRLHQELAASVRNARVLLAEALMDSPPESAAHAFPRHLTSATETLP